MLPSAPARPSTPLRQAFKLSQQAAPGAAVLWAEPPRAAGLVDVDKPSDAYEAPPPQPDMSAPAAPGAQGAWGAAYNSVDAHYAPVRQ